ncbi:hypothetical protein PAP_07810 [Palaeococcus pacificus DY20341]|uniref:Glycosyltransferase 2-like domain-containing protein n=1 Tax=Palaeococcus pacificus DY20341 TaxID=1343739 RepID=A0A075LUZ4_9EURY|nr:glycosyltransferase family 2 protein [Palaeococcus pacificus]AIF69951.1 hypothetical protein PAP_07810 [Palaeococcus pacificus DY20341]
MLLKIALAIIVLWDGYFFLNYLISLLNKYITKEWNPFVSILIPAYNEERNIEKAVSSALAQNYENFEVLVIDDGSEDETFEKAIQIKDPRLRVFKMPHGGKAKALNFGLSKANGEVIVTTDADTQLNNNATKELIKRFHDDVVCVGGQVRVLGHSFLERAQDVEHLRIAMFRRAKELEDLSVAPGPISAFRRDALEKIGGFVESKVEDYATTIELKKVGRVVYAPNAKAFTKMPSSIKTLWRQRKRWFLGDLEHFGGGFEKEWFFLLFGDFITLLDIILPIALALSSQWLLLGFFLAFEVLTILVPTLAEGGSLMNAFLFPFFLWFWALFYLTLHIYGYLHVLFSRV